MKNLSRYGFFALLVCCQWNALGQSKENSIWYFEQIFDNHLPNLRPSYGLDFKFVPPKRVNYIKPLYRGHPAAICDVNGDLLFYTNWDSVWNKNYQMMAGGFGLHGTVSTYLTTSVIVPHPGDGQLYYIFKAYLGDAIISPPGLDYAVVDMSADGGLGAVIKKQYNFIPKVMSMLSVVRHADDRSYWVIAHSIEGNEFYSVHITESGIEPPVVSTIGNSYEWPTIFEHVPQGQMKASPDGTKLGVAIPLAWKPEDGFAELYDFNSNTGVVSNFRQLAVPSAGGIEFSTNSELLYLSALYPPLTNAGNYLSTVTQLDISIGDTDEINRSATQIGVARFSERIGRLQLAPNGKIYGGRVSNDFAKPHLSEINHPNVIGLGCGYVNDSNLELPLAAPLRFPILVQSIFRESPAVQEVISCQGLSTQLRVTSLGYADSLHWDFGDGIQQSFPASSGKIVNHVYTQTGQYPVTVKKYIGDLSRTIASSVTIVEKPIVELPADTILCGGQELLLDAGPDGIQYTWSSGASTQQITIKDQNIYKVTVLNIGCSVSDEIQVNVFDYPLVELGPDQIICDSEFLEITTPANTEFDFLWSTGSISNEITATESGQYKVIVSHGPCVSEDVVHVLLAQVKLALPQSEFEVPFGETLDVEVTGSNMELFRWSFGDPILPPRFRLVTEVPRASHSYLKTGIYSGEVLVSNQHGCSAIATFKVTIPKHLFISNVITANNDGKNDFLEIQYNGYDEQNLLVFDRWGRKVFNSNSFTNKWSATNDDPGIYYYQLKLGQEEYKGWVQVIK